MPLTDVVRGSSYSQDFSADSVVHDGVAAHTIRVACTVARC